MGDSEPLVGPVDLQLVLFSALSPKQMSEAEKEFLEFAVDVEMGRTLLASGVDKDADKNLRNISGVTALVRASVKCHIEIVCLLLEAGADRNLQDRSGETALTHASSTGHVEIVLGAKRAKLNLQARSGLLQD